MSEPENVLPSPSPEVKVSNKDAARFWSKVDKNGPLPDQSNPHYAGLSPCWTWTSAKTPYGYGVFHSHIERLAHRMSWVMQNKSTLNALHVLHLCDNPSCVNPEHLGTGDQSTNMADKLVKDRNLRGERLAQSKATDKSVRKIRQIYAAGGITQDELGAQYGISPSVISRIINRKIWKHVD